METSDIDLEQALGTDDPIVPELLAEPEGPQPVEPFLKALVEIGGSDLHCKTGSPPRVRIDGRLRKLQAPTLTNADTEAMVREVLAERPDCGGVRRHQRGRLRLLRAPESGVSASTRSGPVARPDWSSGASSVGAIALEDLGLPQVVSALAMEPRGLVLVTGPTGSGKTTTLAGMIDHINRNNARSTCVTIEDPIEVLHFDKLSMINQREVEVRHRRLRHRSARRHAAGPRRHPRR